MRRLRYELGYLLLEAGIRMIPDAYPRMKVRMGIDFAAEMMLNEMALSPEEEDG